MLSIRPVRVIQGTLQRLGHLRVDKNSQIGQCRVLLFISRNDVSLRSVVSRPSKLDYTFGRRKRGIDPIAWLLLIIPGAAFALGTWQVKRKFWKEELIEHMHRRLHRQPVPLPLTMEEIDKLEYCPVTVTGTFDHTRELYLGPRSQVNTANHKGGGAGIFSSSSAGYNVITAFKPNDRDYYILVNRGWVPHDRKNPAHRTEGQIQGEVTLNGFIRLNEKRAPFVLANSSERNQWIYRDVDKMAEVADTAPIYIDADENSWIPGGPIGGQTNLNIRNEHLAYIITWYSLSAATLYMWFKRYVPPGTRLR